MSDDGPSQIPFPGDCSAVEGSRTDALRPALLVWLALSVSRLWSPARVDPTREAPPVDASLFLVVDDSTADGCSWICLSVVALRLVERGGGEPTQGNEQAGGWRGEESVSSGLSTSVSVILPDHFPVGEPDRLFRVVRMVCSFRVRVHR